MRDGDQRLLQGRIEALVGAVAGADECRQPAQLKELAHHPHPGTALQGDAEVRRQPQLVQPPHGPRGSPPTQPRPLGPRANLHHSCTRYCACQTEVGGYQALRLSLSVVTRFDVRMFTYGDGRRK